MAKKIFLVLLLFLLCGCISKTDLLKQIEEIVSTEESKDYKSRTNTVTDYFNYYLPSDCYERKGDNTTALIDYSASKITLNLNIKDIISNRYYYDQMLGDDGFFNSDYLIYQNSSTFLKNEEENLRYNLYVYQIDNEFMVHFQDMELQIYAYCYEADLIQVIRHAFILAKGVNIEEEKIIDNYSAKDVIDYEKKQINLFNYVIPNSGYLQELLKGYEEN